MNILSRIHARNVEHMATSEFFRLRIRRAMMFQSPIFIILGIIGLVVANDPSHGGFGKNLGANLFFGIGVAVLTAATLYFWKLLRDTKKY